VSANNSTAIGEGCAVSVANTVKLGKDSLVYVNCPNLSGVGNRAVYSDSTGTLTNTASDARLKKDVETIVDPITKLMSLRGVSYKWIDASRGEATEIGMIAQEVQQVVPEVIGTNADGMLSIDYPKLVAVLTEVCKAQQATIENIITRLAMLESR
jgi:hypothetical protein